MIVGRFMLVQVMVLFSGSLVYAQTTTPGDSSDYFPMELGNEWTYYQVVEPPDQPRDIAPRGTFRFGERIDTDSTVYYTYDFGSGRIDTLRADEQGRIWRYVRGQEALLFDFTLDDGESYRYSPHGESGWQYDVSVRRGKSVDVVAGYFENCLSINFDDPRAIDEEERYTFAPGVGIVTWHTAWDSGLLHSARVGAEVITAVDEPEVLRRAVDLSIYPNPVFREANVQVRIRAPGQVKLRIYDALGRNVRVVSFDRSRGNTFSTRLDVSDLSSGTYFLLVEGGAGFVGATSMSVLK